jgi:membrane associated rhomboid family serine protease
VLLGTVVGAIYGVIVAFAFMFPNAELALMFIPVPIKAKIFCPRFSISGFISRYLRSIYFRRRRYCTFAHVGGALFGFNHVVKKSVQR